MASLSLEKLNEIHDISSFDCDDVDLNNYLKDDALLSQYHLLSTTYVVLSDGSLIAYFSVLNDKIHINEADKQIWNKLGRMIPNKKRRSSYPAIKIGRLGVSCTIHRGGMGTTISDYVKVEMGMKSICGCRFITVDANNDGRAIPFYQKMGFEFLKESDKRDKTRLMYFDLRQLI